MTALRLRAVVAFVSIALSWPADTRQCVVAIDIGHSESRPGAISARGAGEYTFNRNIARRLLEKLHMGGRSGSFLVEVPGDDRSLVERTRAARRGGADFFISIHHDSVQPSYLTEWTYRGAQRRYSDRFSGFSLFVSRKGPNARANLALARSISTQLLNAGFHATLHHAEKVRGEGRDLIDRERGIYAFDDLAILRTATMPAVLLECGIIVNREEEQRLLDPAYQDRLVAAVAAGIARECGAGPHETSARPTDP